MSAICICGITEDLHPDEWCKKFESETAHMDKICEAVNLGAEDTKRLDWLEAHPAEATDAIEAWCEGPNSLRAAIDAAIQEDSK